MESLAAWPALPEEFSMTRRRWEWILQTIVHTTAPEYSLASASYYTGQISDCYSLSSVKLKSLLSTAMTVVINIIQYCDIAIRNATMI